MKIYIAGKISGLPYEQVRSKFTSAAEKLKQSGHTPLIPTYIPAMPGMEYEDYMHLCFAMIDICDAIYLLDDWQHSLGARRECQYAHDWHKKIIYEDQSTIEPSFP